MSGGDPHLVRGDGWMVLMAGVLGATAVGLGAWQAHGLEDFLMERSPADKLSERVEQFGVGVRYQMVHAVALLASAAVGAGRIVAWLWVAGILLFSGSLYWLVLLEVPVMGAVTPLGGLALITGWMGLAVGGWRSRR